LKDMPDHQHALALARDPYQFRPIRERCSKRLLNQYRLARRQRLLRDRKMRARRRRDHHGFDFGILEQVVESSAYFNIPVKTLRAHERLGVDIAGHYSPGASQLVQGAKQVRPPITEPDHADSAQLFARFRSGRSHLHKHRYTTQTPPRRRAIGVRTRIRRSRSSDQCSMYSMSRLTISSKERRLRPLTCHISTS